MTVKAKVEYSQRVSHNAWTQGQNTRKYSWSSPCQIGQASHELWGKAHSREYSTEFVRLFNSLRIHRWARRSIRSTDCHGGTGFPTTAVEVHTSIYCQNRYSHPQFTVIVQQQDLLALRLIDNQNTQCIYYFHCLQSMHHPCHACSQI